MNINKIIYAIMLGTTAFGMTACGLSKDDLKTIVRREAGKDDFRDSKKWGKVITKTFDLSTFTHIHLTGNVDVKFVQGDVQSVEAYGNEKAIESNDIRVEGNVLTVSKKANASGNVPSIKLVVTAPDIESVQAAGAGDIDIKGDIVLSGNLDIELSGAGDVEIGKLKCSALNVVISGAGDVTAKKIACEQIDLQMSGTGDIDADIKATNITLTTSGAGDADLDVKCDNLTVTAKGTGDIELEGECTNLTKSTSGMASINSRKLHTKNISIK